MEWSNAANARGPGAPALGGIDLGDRTCPADAPTILVDNRELPGHGDALGAVDGSFGQVGLHRASIAGGHNSQAGPAHGDTYRETLFPRYDVSAICRKL